MPGSEATSFVSGPEEILNPTSEVGLSTPGDGDDFNSAWEDLLEAQKSRQKAIDKEERFGGEPTKRAFEIAFAHPDKVDVTIEPFGRKEDMADHLQHHFDRLLNDDDVGASLKSGDVFGDIDHLFKFCELAFIDDAMYRFAQSHIFTPKVDGLESMGFIGLPADAQSPFIDAWHQDMEIVYQVLLGELKEGFRLKDKIDNLYDERDEFISYCKDHNIFMPITIDCRGGSGDRERKIKTRLRRGAQVPPSDMHKYCYLKYRNY